MSCTNVLNAIARQVFKMKDPEWHCQNSDEYLQHLDEIEEYDEEMNKEPPWWHFIEEWLKEKIGDRLR